MSDKYLTDEELDSIARSRGYRRAGEVFFDLRELANVASDKGYVAGEKAREDEVSALKQHINQLHHEIGILRRTIGDSP